MATLSLLMIPLDGAQLRRFFMLRAEGEAHSGAPRRFTLFIAPNYDSVLAPCILLPLRCWRLI